MVLLSQLRLALCAARLLSTTYPPCTCGHICILEHCLHIWSIFAYFGAYLHLEHIGWSQLCASAVTTVGETVMGMNPASTSQRAGGTSPRFVLYPVHVRVPNSGPAVLLLKK